MAAGGASCGVAQASNVAAAHHEIKALVLLSGRVGSTVMKYLALPTAPAVFGAAGQRDPSAGNVVAVARASKNPRSVAQEFSDAAHANRMFGAHGDLERTIVQWLQSTTK